MKKLIYISLFFICLSLAGYAQRPVVSSISPKSAAVNGNITITGANFPAATDLLVQFGAVKALTAVVNAAGNEITVPVPAGATFDFISVTNISTGLSAKSAVPFLPVFSGNAFNLASLVNDEYYLANTGMSDLCACDLNSDGRIDVVSTHENRLTLAVLKNGSTSATYSITKTDYPLNAYSRDIVCGDMDGDGRPDLVVSGAGVNGNKLYLLRNLSAAGGAISFAGPVSLSLENSGAAKVALHDLNADGRPDIIMTNRASNVVTIFKNASSAGFIQFDAQAQQLTITGAASVHGLSVADLDGDGLVDLAVTPLQGSNVYLLRNTSSGNSISFVAGPVLSSNPGLVNIVAADLNGDGKPELAATNYYYNTVAVWTNNSSAGSLNFTFIEDIETGTQPWGITAGDIDGNGLIDLLVSPVGERTLRILANAGTGNTLVLQPYSIVTRQKGKSLQLADVNGDAKPEILFTGTEWGQLEIIRNMHCVVPKITPNSTLTLCAGQTVRLQATQALAATYKWTRNGQALAATTSYLDITEAGNYDVSIVSSVDAGCSLKSAVVQVISGSGAGGSISMNAIAPSCVGGAVVLEATAIAGATYVWNGPNGFTATTSTPKYTLNNVQTAAAGSYSVVVKSGDCQFTPAAQNLTVHPNPQPQITASATAFCAGTTITLNAQPGFASYQWKLNGAPYTGAGATSASIGTGNAGNYTVLVTSSAGCSAESAAISVSQTQAPVANFSAPAAACLQQPLSFQNTSTFASGHTPAYQWTFGDGQTSTEANPSHLYAATGNYTVNLTVSYGGQSCSNSSSKTINVVASPDVQLLAAGSTTFCPGDSLELVLTGDVLSVLWSTGETSPSIYAKEAGTYKATIATSVGCTLERSVEINHFTQPEISISASASTINVGESVQLSAGGALQYEWLTAEGINDYYSPTITATPIKTTTYTVKGWGANGCYATAEITIAVDNSLRINPPKVFVPAVDGSWSIADIVLYPDIEVNIVNSMGRTVYSAMPYNNGWDGAERGRPLEAGVYYYIFKNSGGKILKTGSITLLR